MATFALLKKIKMNRFLLLIFISVFSASKANELVIENPYSQQFKKAYALYPSVPKGILEAVSYSQTRFQHLNNPEHTCNGIPTAFGVMGLVEKGKNYFITEDKIWHNNKKKK